MNNLFIPYEQALHLKELGFQEECLAYYHQDQMLEKDSLCIKIDHYRGKFGVLAPLYQQAFRWLRENHLLFTSIFMYGDMNGYLFKIDELEHNGIFLRYKSEELEDTYEEAELACLKKLIEIAKGQNTLTNFTPHTANEVSEYNNSLKNFTPNQKK